MSELRTQRLLLRSWRAADLEPWAAMNADPEVRAHFPEVWGRAESAASIRRYQAGLDARGWGWWAVEVVASGELAGFAGLDSVDEETPATGIEVGWRLARHCWGHGYATEAGRAALDFGFRELDLPEIIAVAARDNLRSRAVMRRLGMTYDPAVDFEDPAFPEGSPLRHHVIHRLARPA